MRHKGRQEGRGRLLRWGDGGIFKRPEEAKLEERTEAAEDGGGAAEDDGESFEEKMQRLTAEPGGGQRQESARLDAEIWADLKELGYEI